MKRLFQLLASALCLTLAVSPAQAQNDASLRFPSDGKLKIAVFADVQTTQMVPQDLLDNLNAVLDQEQPDLVVYLGDQVEGMHPYIHLGNNESHVRHIIDQVLSPVVERNIPFAVVFGNHDSHDAGVPKEPQMEYYRSFPGCLSEDADPSLPGCGTCHLLYYTADGSRPAVDLYFVDSLEYDPSGGYGCVSREQIAWCAAEMEASAQANGGQPVPAVYFQHIVVPEIYDTFTQADSKEAAGAFEGHGIGKGTWYTAPAGMEGVLEAPCPPDFSNGQFAAWREAGNVKAAFFGHDHVNSYIARLDGIDLVACPGASYTSYNDREARGVRMIEIDEATGDYTTRVIRFKDLEQPGFAASVRRFFGQTHMWDLELPAAALVLANAVFWPVFLRRRKKRAVQRREKIHERK